MMKYFDLRKRGRGQMRTERGREEGRGQRVSERGRGEGFNARGDSLTQPPLHKI